MFTFKITGRPNEVASQLQVPHAVIGQKGTYDSYPISIIAFNRLPRLQGAITIEVMAQRTFKDWSDPAGLLSDEMVLAILGKLRSVDLARLLRLNNMWNQFISNTPSLMKEVRQGKNVVQARDNFTLIPFDKRPTFCEGDIAKRLSMTNPSAALKFINTFVLGDGPSLNYGYRLISYEDINHMYTFPLANKVINELTDENARSFLLEDLYTHKARINFEETISAVQEADSPIFERRDRIFKSIAPLCASSNWTRALEVIGMVDDPDYKHGAQYNCIKACQMNDFDKALSLAESLLNENPERNLQQEAFYHLFELAHKANDDRKDIVIKKITDPHYRVKADLLNASSSEPYDVRKVLEVARRHDDRERIYRSIIEKLLKLNRIDEAEMVFQEMTGSFWKYLAKLAIAKSRGTVIAVDSFKRTIKNLGNNEKILAWAVYLSHELNRLKGLPRFYNFISSIADIPDFVVGSYVLEALEILSIPIEKKIKIVEKMKKALQETALKAIIDKIKPDELAELEQLTAHIKNRAIKTQIYVLLSKI